MKRQEKQIKRFFSRAELSPRASFKQNLRSELMTKSNKQSSKNTCVWAIPVFGLAVLAVGVLTLPLLGGTDDKKVAELPFGSETVSASTLENRSKEFYANLKNVPLITSTETTDEGPQFACYPGGMGIQPGETFVSSAFLSKDSGTEAYYKKIVVDGQTKDEFSYYNAAGSDLSEVIDSLIGYPFTLEGYKEVTKEEYKPVKRDGKSAYVVRAIPDVTETCEGDEIVYEFIIDSATYALLETNRYRELYGDENLVARYQFSTKTVQANEQKAIERMQKQGFDRKDAATAIPDRVLLQQ